MPLPPLTQIPPEIASLDDYAAFARERMTASAWAYLNGAAADGVTMAENVAAFRRLRLRSRVLADLAGGSTAVDLLGERLEHPLLLAPVAYQRLAHPDGELATAVAAGAMRACMVVSTQASVLIEEIARVAEGPLWFQLYIQPDRGFTEALVRRAEAAGYRALVVTVDAPVSGVRNEEQRAGFALPPGVAAVNLAGMRPPPPHTARAGESPFFGGPLAALSPTWKDLEWLRGLTRLPVLVKGVTGPEDAVRAVEIGAAGIVVSNHGGRTLDTLPATVDLLPPIAEAVAGQVPLLLDGGVRRGTDVLKVLALGASAVLIGRPYVHALAAAGPAGVAHVLHILRTELEIAMALSGCRSIGDIDRTILHPG